MNFSAKAIILFIVGIFSTSVKTDDDAPADQCPVLQPKTQQCLTTETIKNSINQFTVRMYQEVVGLSSTARTDNIILLPLHASNALLISCHAAAGDTKTEIMNALKLGSGLECLDAYAVIQDLYRRTPHKSDPPLPMDDVTFAINRQYVDKQVKLKPAYVSGLAERFNQTPGVVDFKNNADGARNEINKWVETQTLGNIKNLNPPGSVGSSTMATVVNAHYLQINWGFPFNPSLTEKRPFTNADGSVSQVDTMRRVTTSLFYFDNLNQKAMPKVPAFHMIRLPDKWGKGMLSVFVPKEASGLPTLEKALTAEVILEAMDKAQRRLTNVSLPKFAFEKTLNLADAVKGLGIAKLFGPNVDFSPMTDTRNVRMDRITHKTMIDVNERGLKAAAATAVLSHGKTTGVAKIVTFTVDKPFFFAIRLEEPKMLTYLGRVTKLSSQGVPIF